MELFVGPFVKDLSSNVFISLGNSNNVCDTFFCSTKFWKHCKQYSDLGILKNKI